MIGCGIVGLLTIKEESVDSCIDVNRIVILQVLFEQERKHCHFALKTQVKEVLTTDQINRMFDLEFSEREENQALSQFLENASQGIYRQPDKHELPLPLRNPNVILPNNREKALVRLNSLKQRPTEERATCVDEIDVMQDTLPIERALGVQWCA